MTAYLTEIGLDPETFPVAIGPFAAGSSSVEPGLTPASDLTLTYPSIAAMVTAGGESRLDGGMHFDLAVPAGEELCWVLPTTPLLAFLDCWVRKDGCRRKRRNMSTLMRKNVDVKKWNRPNKGICLYFE